VPERRRVLSVRSTLPLEFAGGTICPSGPKVGAPARHPSVGKKHFATSVDGLELGREVVSLHEISIMSLETIVTTVSTMPMLAEMPLNLLDWFLLLVLLFFLVSGFRKGLIWQVLAIVGVIIAFLVAGRYHVALAETSPFEWVRNQSAQAALVAAFLVIFIAVSFFTGLIASSIGKRMRERGLGTADKSLGAVIGLAKGVLLLGGVAIGIQQWTLPQGIAMPADVQGKADSIVAESFLVPRLSDACIWMIDKIPQAEREKIAEFWEAQKKIFLGEKGEKDEKASPTGEGTTPDAGELSTRLNADPGARIEPGIEPLGDRGTATPTPAAAKTEGDGAMGDADSKPAQDIISRLAEKPGGRLPDLGTLRRFHVERNAARTSPLGGTSDLKLTPGTAPENEATPAPGTPEAKTP